MIRVGYLPFSDGTFGQGPLRFPLQPIQPIQPLVFSDARRMHLTTADTQCQQQMRGWSLGTYL